MGSGESGLAGEMVHIRRFTVAACRECNSALGDRVYQTLADRKREAQAHLRRKYRKLLQMPGWTEEELTDVGPSLRSSIGEALKRRDEIRERCRW